MTFKLVMASGEEIQKYRISESSVKKNTYFRGTKGVPSLKREQETGRRQPLIANVK